MQKEIQYFGNVIGSIFLLTEAKQVTFTADIGRNLKESYNYRDIIIIFV